MAREIDSLRECTFTPSLPPPPLPLSHPSNSQPIIVRGLGRHLELRHQAIRLRQEKQEREQEVFTVTEISKLRRVEDGGTIVRPFCLSESSGKQSKAVLEAVENEESECTFVPVTSVARRRDLISRQAKIVF